MKSRLLALATAVLATAPTIAPTPGLAQPQGAAQVRIAHVSTLFDYAPVWMAARQGYFRDEGLDVTYTVTGSVPRTAEGLANGDFEIAITVPEGTISNVESGGELRVIAGMTHTGVSSAWTRFSRTCCTTFQDRGTISRVSVTSSRSLASRVEPQHEQAVGPRTTTRSRGR